LYTGFIGYRDHTGKRQPTGNGLLQAHEIGLLSGIMVFMWMVKVKFSPERGIVLFL
jgi:hypothetical protein